MSYDAHETARVDPGAIVGDGTRIWHFTHVMAGARVGRGCTLGQNVFVSGGAIVGDGVKIQNNVSIYDGVTLEDGVFCGPSAVFTNVVTPRSHVSRRHAFARTIVRQGATVGANSTLLCGIEIGRYAFIGAGAVVTRDVPAFALVVGNPARHVGWACACGVRIGPRRAAEDASHAGRVLVCAACGAGYRVRDGAGELVAAAGEPVR